MADKKDTKTWVEIDTQNLSDLRKMARIYFEVVLQLEDINAVKREANDIVKEVMECDNES